MVEDNDKMKNIVHPITDRNDDEDEDADPGAPPAKRSKVDAVGDAWRHGFMLLNSGNREQAKLGNALLERETEKTPAELAALKERARAEMAEKRSKLDQLAVCTHNTITHPSHS